MTAKLTKTKTITFNREDWTGREITIRVNRETGSLNVHDDDFKLEFRDIVDDDLTFHECDVTHKGRKVFGIGRTESAVPILNDKNWTAIHGDIIREHADPFVCAALVLCMTW